MADKNVNLLAPPSSRATKRSFNGVRRLCCYCNRWKVERLFTCLHSFRLLVVRNEYHAEEFHALLQLAASIIFLRYF